MTTYAKKIVAALLTLFFIINSCLSAMAEESLNSTTEATAIQRLYVEEGVENVVLICDRSDLDFHEETAEFKAFRLQYGLLWTGIIVGLYIYSYSRGR